MNENNYASLEASKRLVEAGIVLETEFYWTYSYQSQDDEWSYIVTKDEPTRFDRYPAPSMAEVWRELPKVISKNDNHAFYLIMSKVGDGITEVGYDTANPTMLRNENPTDALIDLLIWVIKDKT